MQKYSKIRGLLFLIVHAMLPCLSDYTVYITCVFDVPKAVAHATKGFFTILRPFSDFP